MTKQASTPGPPLGTCRPGGGRHRRFPRLAWTEYEVGALAFRIERADGIGSACLFSEIGRTGVHVVVFRDGAVHPRKSYSYRVHAWNDSGVSVALQCGGGNDVAGRDGIPGG